MSACLMLKAIELGLPLLPYYIFGAIGYVYFPSVFALMTFIERLSLRKRRRFLFCQIRK